MDQNQTIPFPQAASFLDSETDPETPEQPSSQTVVFTDLPAKDTGNSALEQLDALHSLVQEEAKEHRRAAGAPGSHGSEESLDDYMKRFMERMTGKPELAPSPVESVQPPPAVVTPVEPRQPSRAPESSESLHQMRDLANASSRSAIHIHQRRQLSSNMLVYFLPAVAASLASTGLALLAATTGLSWQTGSTVLLVAALALAWRFWTVRRRLLQEAREARTFARAAD